MSDTKKIHETVERLARLSPVDYEQCRNSEAKELNMRVSVLDKAVEAARPKPESENAPDELIDGIEPCGYKVNGNELAKIIKGCLNKHLVLPTGADTAITLWIMASYLIDNFRIFPRLCLSSPEKRCGKTTTLEVIQAMSNRALPASNLSTAVMFRAIEKWKPTLLIDEADSFLDGKDELRGIINSGHTRSGAFVLRNEKKDNEWQPRKFSTWCPMVIAMIKKPPDTIIDRSVMIELQRKKSNEVTERIPLDFIDSYKRTRAELKQWAIDAGIIDTSPDMPQLNNDRAMDNWSVLIAVADLIGWGDEARQVMIRLNSESDDDIAIGTRLLADIRDVLTKDKITSIDLVGALTSDKDNIWCEYNHGQPLTPTKLSQLLKTYNIKPKTIRINSEKTKKGYDVSQFKDAFDRYLS